MTITKAWEWKGIIDCDKDCPYQDRMPHESAIRYHQIRTAICSECRLEQLQGADAKVTYLHEVIAGIAEDIDAGEIRDARERCE